MKYSKCGKNFPERLIEESHDIPCYLFRGKIRKERKDQADKFGRHWLCNECHKKYEMFLWIKLTSNLDQKQKKILIPIAQKYSKQFFREAADDKGI